MVTFPNAKINLGLQIVEKLPHGYHQINTCFYPIPWHDLLEVVVGEKTRLQTSGISIPGNAENNLVLKAVRLIERDHPLPALTIHLHKCIPMGAGLGGGSSDAAFMLKLLNETFRLSLDQAMLEKYAARLGSDCPFFIRNKPAIASGTGTTLSPVDLSLKGYWLTAVYPGIHLSTREAYAGVQPKIPAQNLREIIVSNDFDRWKKELVNDFESSLFRKYPQLAGIKRLLYESGALYAGMSGSGSTIIGLFEKEPVINKPGAQNFVITTRLL